MQECDEEREERMGDELIGDEQVRPATVADWNLLVPLLREMGHLRHDGALQRFTAIAQNADHFLAVYNRGDHFLGYIWAQDYGPHLRSGDRTARLHDLFVVRQHRREGIGAALFRSAVSWAEHRAVRYLAWQARQDAVPFYERLGYRGDPCPQPEFPYFEVTFGATR